MYLVMGCRVPVGETLGVGYTFFQTMGAECAKDDGRGTKEAAGGPEWRCHCCGDEMRYVMTS